MYRVPDHSTFSENRKRCFKDASILREIFNEIVLKCIEIRTIMWISGNWFRRWICYRSGTQRAGNIRFPEDKLAELSIGTLVIRIGIPQTRE